MVLAVQRKGYIRELAVQKPAVKNTEKHVFPARGPLHNVASGITSRVVVKEKKEKKKRKKGAN